VSTVRSTRRANGVSLLLPLWEAACRRALAGFRRRLVLGPASNTLTLRRILRRHADSEFGRRHGFSELLREPDLETAWADALPVAEYDSFRSDIARMANGEPRYPVSRSSASLRQQLRHDRRSRSSFRSPGDSRMRH
jgi:hypothetical protein